MILAHYDKNNTLKGFYNTESFSGEIPEPNVEVETDERDRAVRLGLNKINLETKTFYFDDGKTTEQRYKEDALKKVQAMLDTEAQSRGYDNINSIGKYLGYDNLFRAECEALGAWTAACWAKCYEIEAEGRMPENILNEMPELAL